MDHSAHSMSHADHGLHRASMSGDDTDISDDSGTSLCGGGHEMSMSFHVGVEETILFEQWRTTTVGGLIGSMFGIMLMAALYEGLKYYREYLFWKTYNSLQYRSVRIPAEKAVQSTTEESGIVHMVSEVIHKQPPTMWNLMHCYQTFLHAVQIILSYFIMLIFMTYNVYLCLAVVVGAAIGYFLFGWKKSVVVDVTEHCH